jgi:RNA polymerase-binding transcription factor DksA
MSRALGPFDPVGTMPVRVSADQAVAEGEYPYTPADLESFATLLGIMQRGLAGEITHLQRRASAPAGGLGDSAMEWDHMLAAGAVADKRGLLYDIERALARIARNTFGLCTVDYQVIPRDRLMDMPWIEHCEHCATHARPGMPMDAFGVFRASAPIGDLAD